MPEPAAKRLSRYECEHLKWVRWFPKHLEGKCKVFCVACHWCPFPPVTMQKEPDAVTQLGNLAAD